MADEKLCRLCQAEQALDVDIEKSSYKSANNLLQRLFECYNLDVSVLGENSSTCKPCFEWVLQISEQLQKWSNAQKVLQKTAFLPDTEDHTVISVKEESGALWDENDDAEFLPEDGLGLDETSNSNDFEFLNEEEQPEDLEFPAEEEPPQTGDVELLNEEEPQKEDVESFAEDPSTNHAEGVSAKVYEELFGIEQIQEKPAPPLDWKLTPQEFFGVCLSPNGLVLAVLFKDKTPQRNIRFLCTCCKQVFATVSDVHKHSLVSRAHPDYWCRLCGLNFASIAELKFHQEDRNHQLENSNLVVIKCIKCGKISKLFSSAIRHQNTIHEKVSFNCNKCSMSFDSCISLAKHEAKHKLLLWEQRVNHLNRHNRFASHCPVPGYTSILMPGEHVKHLKTHSKNQVKFINRNR